MLRGIAGVIVGWLASVIFVFVCLTVAYFALGNDRVFALGNYDASLVWLVTMLLIGLIGALIGGSLCAAISGGGKAPMVLAIIVLALGLLMAVTILGGKPVMDRPEGTSMMVAMQNIRRPPWFLLINPFLQAIFVMIGASLKKTKT